MLTYGYLWLPKGIFKQKHGSCRGGIMCTFDLGRLRSWWNHLFRFYWWHFAVQGPCKSYRSEPGHRFGFAVSGDFCVPRNCHPLVFDGFVIHMTVLAFVNYLLERNNWTTPFPEMWWAPGTEYQSFTGVVQCFCKAPWSSAMVDYQDLDAKGSSSTCRPSQVVPGCAVDQSACFGKYSDTEPLQNRTCSHAHLFINPPFSRAATRQFVVFK